MEIRFWAVCRPVMVLVWGLVVFMILACASPQTRSGSTRTTKRIPESIRSRPDGEKSAGIGQGTRLEAGPISAGGLKDLLEFYRDALDRWAAVSPSGAYAVSPPVVERFKSELSRSLGIATRDIKILSNKRDQSAWFGTTIVAVESETGEAHFVDLSGQHFQANLKDRIFGGMDRDKKGNEALFSAFYGEPQTREFYRVYLNARKLRVISFELDRENKGSIRARVVLPSGRSALITRKGRDNRLLEINGRKLLPLFE